MKTLPKTLTAPFDYAVKTTNAYGVIANLDNPVYGEELREMIEANLAGQSSPELCAIHLVRRRGDITAAMPRFVTAFLEMQLPA